MTNSIITDQRSICCQTWTKLSAARSSTSEWSATSHLSTSPWSSWTRPVADTDPDSNCLNASANGCYVDCSDWCTFDSRCSARRLPIQRRWTSGRQKFGRADLPWSCGSFALDLFAGLRLFVACSSFWWGQTLTYWSTASFRLRSNATITITTM